jgi:4-hydroxythreonine-4-phosphate dehydrogenase
MKDKPLLAITMGDPAGVGPEVVLKALSHESVRSSVQLLVIGNQQVLRRAAELLNLEYTFTLIHDVEEISPSSPRAYLIEQPPYPDPDFPVGRIDADCGLASGAYVEYAIKLACSDRIDGIVTAPINKASWLAAGITYKGHTELLADRTGTKQVTMMLATPGRFDPPQWLRVTHATTHIPLKQVPANLSMEGILKTIEITAEGLKLLGIHEPTLALAAFNPHASDDGLMGDEEARLLTPAVVQANRNGFNVHGPIPADTVFLRAINGEFDAVITLYHDQGHIPVKTYGFERAVNITLGLPIIRTSVDHGTAFDIAWKGVANEESMVAAIMTAKKMAEHQYRS